MRKTMGFRVRQRGVASYTVEATEISTSGSMISLVASDPETDLNPFPEKYIVRMLSVHNLDWIDPIYEEEEVEDE